MLSAAGSRPLGDHGHHSCHVGNVAADLAVLRVRSYRWFIRLFIRTPPPTVTSEQGVGGVGGGMGEGRGVE